MGGIRDREFETWRNNDGAAFALHDLVAMPHVISKTLRPRQARLVPICARGAGSHTQIVSFRQIRTISGLSADLLRSAPDSVAATSRAAKRCRAGSNSLQPSGVADRFGSEHGNDDQAAAEGGIGHVVAHDGQKRLAARARDTCDLRQRLLQARLAAFALGRAAQREACARIMAYDTRQAACERKGGGGEGGSAGSGDGGGVVGGDLGDGGGE